MWWVYVLKNTTGRSLTYVGIAKDPRHRLRQHNGEIPGGARFTRQGRPWNPAALYGPYQTHGDALRAEIRLKKQRGIARLRWSETQDEFCKGLGPKDPWCLQNNQEISEPAK